MIPCITNKCLKYPACKNKAIIVCTEIIDFIDRDEFRDNPMSIWAYFPRAHNILIDPEDEEDRTLQAISLGKSTS